MDSCTQERVERWDSRPFAGGYDELASLAADEFSGAVAAGGAWLFMLNGRVVGVVDGDIDDFADASGTRYDAPHPSLPLLCSMEERGGETRAKYYTNETPLAEVDATLREGSFTGYVELSEKVLSGDYYAVYYGGRRMAAAYIGNAERLLTGDEAFERAAGEVGIYEVTDVDVEVTDVPSGDTDSREAEPSTADGASVADDTATADAEPTTAGDEHAAIDPVDAGADPETGREAERTADAEPAVDPADALEAESDSGTEAVAGADPDARGTVGTDPDAETGSATGGDELEDESIVTEAESTRDAPRGRTDSARSGITATDDESPEPSSPGITDAPTRAGDKADSTAGSANEPTASSSDDAVPVEDATDDVDDSPAATESGDAATSSPSPEEVEAAAADLDGDDVPWAGTDAEADATRAESSAEGDATAPGAESAPDAVDEEGNLEERFKQEEQWRETRNIPSLDPDHSETPDRPSATGAQDQSAAADRSTARSSADSTGDRRAGGDAGSVSEPAGSGRSEREDRTRADRGREASRTAGVASGNAAGRDGRSDADSSSSDEPLESDMLEREDRIDQLTQRVDDLERRRDALRSKAEELEEERDRLRSENQELSATVERLQGRIDELETELEEARADAAAGSPEAAASRSGTELSAARALAETNLFVRYDSKSQPTLQSAYDGDADRGDVAANLRLEHHTQFDESTASVDGLPYEEFLASTMEYQFVDWLVGTLLYEIRDTGRKDGLSDLYDAIPRIDRAELRATVSLADDDTEDVPDEVTFDVVAFDKRGNPLVVASLNDSRDPATQGMLETLEEEASAVAANYPELGAAFVVTSSFFEPGALEVTEQATSGGFLSRSGSLSYVNLSRKQGYHLCLVESRGGGFHVNVPEL